MQFDPQRIKQDFTKASTKYHQHALLQRRVSYQLIKLLKEHISVKSTDRIIDAGCGTGFFAEKSMQTNWQITQCDISEAMLHQAATFKYPCLSADINNMPIIDSCFDSVFSSLCLQWINNLQQTLSEFYRILKPNGIAAISTLVEGTLFELKDSFNHTASIQPRISEFLSNDIYIQKAQAEGFEIIVSKNIVDIEYFNNLRNLMQSLKNIGATNKAHNRHKGLSGKNLFNKAESYYKETYGNGKTIPASYHVLLLILKRK